MDSHRPDRHTRLAGWSPIWLSARNHHRELRRSPMRMSLPALGGLVGGILLGVAGLALAQINIGSQGFFGNEVIEVAQGGPGGPSTFGTVGRISSGRSRASFPAFPTASFTIGGAVPTGTTVRTDGVASGGDLLFNVANGTA